MAKRANRQGSVYKIKSGPKKGKWVARLLVDAPTGARHRYRYRNTYGEALAALDGIKEDVRGGINFDAEKLTLSDYLDRWLKDSVKDSVKEKTYDGYAYNVRVVPEWLGAKRLGEITPAHIQALYRSKLDDGLSNRTVRYLHTTLRKALNQALRWRLIEYNPVEDARQPRKMQRKVGAFSKEEVDKIREVIAGDPYEALYLTAIFSGLRSGELFGLRHEDLTLDDPRPALEVRQQLVSSSSGYHFDEPKGKRSRRVEIPALAVSALRSHLKKQKEVRLAAGSRWQSRNLVFTGPRGGLVKYKNFMPRYYYPMLERAGLPRRPFHSLRHTYATLMLPTGINPKIVSEAMGHASVSITLDLYSHVLPTMQSEAVSRLNSLFEEAK